MDYLLHVVILIGIYAIVALALDLVAGHAGLLSLGQAAFFGLGAYVAAILGTRVGLSAAVTGGVALLLGAAASLLLSIPSLRLRDDYFILASFAFSQVMFSMATNWIHVTGGARGIPNVPPFQLLSARGAQRGLTATLVLLLLAGILAVYVRATSGATGRALHALREDEMLVQAYGKNTFLLKVEIFAWSGAITAWAGSIYTHYIGFADPSVLNPTESIAILSMVVIGGAGGCFGGPIGAAVVVGLPELLRLIGLPGGATANFRQVLYGGLLAAAMLLRPRGLIGKFDFSNV